MIRYALGWLAIGAVVTAGLLAVLGGSDAEDEVALPPVREIELSAAVRQAGCMIRRAARGQRLDPPVDGPHGARSATPGVYERPPLPRALGAATRHGFVVIYYHPGLAGDDVGELRTLQRTIPAGTIVTPSRSRVAYELAAAGYRRLLLCRRFSATAIDATRLFTGRYLGTGPETGA